MSPTYPATLLSVVKPLLGSPGVQTAGRTVMSHSVRGHALIKPRVGRDVDGPDRGSASRRKVSPEGRQLGGEPDPRPRVQPRGR
jgi:hypothetical protein